ARQLRRLDRGIAATAVLDLIDGRREADVLQALHATRRAGPENPLAWFRARLGERIRGEAVAAAPRSNPAIKRVADPYE
ncbi:MAG: hypothetical protein AB7I33_13975, partial [Gemmatimonadales bacterium]